ncbi:hypothetical protein LXL04_035571 [Taraxacum kok-saghyz]
MDAIRKQLDVLMGANRNGDVREVNRKYYDRDVCRLFLVGLCPHELFQLTKMDMGPCPKVHSFQLRKEYQEAKAKGQDNYDRELEDVIDRLIVECDRKIARALKRLSEEDAKAAIAISVSEVTQTPEILELSKQIKEKLKEADQNDLEGKADMKIRALEMVEELRTQRADKQSMLLLDAFNKDRASLPQPLPNPPPLAPLPVGTPDARTQELINEKLKKAEDLGEQGMLDEAQKALEEAEALKKLSMHLPPRQEPVTDSSKYTAADVRVTDQKLRVCDICGAFLSVYDSDRRLADHFGGKLHLGYMQIREKLADLQLPFSFPPTSYTLKKVANFRKRKTIKGRRLKKTEDQKNELGKLSGKEAETGTEQVAETVHVTGTGTKTAGAGTVTGTMTVTVTVTVAMTVTGLVATTRGVDTDPGHGQGNVVAIMIVKVKGVMIDISLAMKQMKEGLFSICW